MLSKEAFEKQKNERLEKVFYTSYGTPYKIIEYRKATDVTVKFMDEYGYIKNTSYGECEKRYVTNPYDRTVCGIGYRGVTSDGIVPGGKLYPREFRLWHSMMARCYNSKYHEQEPTYKECYVCDRWLCFANFLEDLPFIDGYDKWYNNTDKKMALDKDVKIKGNKIYSIDTCMFISSDYNVAESNQRNKSKAILMINLETNEKIMLEKMKDAFPYLGCGNEGYGYINKCINGERKSYKGYTFKTAEDMTDVAITD